jgi:hypothetical protein
MTFGAQTNRMTTIVPIPVQTTMRRSLTGALAGDAVLDERRRLARRPRAARGGADRARAVRTPATASQG